MLLTPYSHMMAPKWTLYLALVKMVQPDFCLKDIYSHIGFNLLSVINNLLSFCLLVV